VLGRNDPKLGEECPRNWGGTTVFGADRPGADRLWGLWTGTPINKLYSSIRPNYAQGKTFLFAYI